MDAIAVTEGPGLVGALLIGVNAAKALAFAHNIPLVPVHHIAGHIYANRLSDRIEVSPSCLCCFWGAYGACLYEGTWTF